MTFRDMIDISLGNLRRMKLRAFLTISGVVIAIGWENSGGKTGLSFR